MHGLCKQLTTVIILLLFTQVRVHAQKTYYNYNHAGTLEDITNYWEIDITLGANQFLGDLGGTKGIGRNGIKDYVFNINRLLGGVSATHNFNNFSAGSLTVNYGTIYGADSLIKNTGGMERWRYNRNLSFRSRIIEVAGTYTWYPIMHFNRRKVELYRFDPFISAGIGLMFFNPKAKLGDRWYALQTLRTEGQNFDEYPGTDMYRRTKVFIPVNLGLKYYFNNKLALSGGAMSRITFTDYLDDVGKNYIDPSLYDKYFFPDKAAIAKQLYSRSKTPEKVKPGVVRADNSDNDTYLTFFLRLSIRLDKRGYIFIPLL